MTKLFKPLSIGGSEHAHRIVMAPLTRYRCDDDWIPLPIVKGASHYLIIIPQTYD